MNEKRFKNISRAGSRLSACLAVLMVFSMILSLTTQTAAAKGFSGKKGSQYTVYDGGQITYGSGAGGYSNSRKCDLGDDLGSRYSYCVQPSKLSPGTGTVTVDKVVTDDNDTGKWNALRNIVYYSPSYPGYEDNVKNIKDNYYTGNFSKDWGIAHLALSYVYEGRPSDMATFGGTHASDLGDVWTKAKKLGDALWKTDSSKDDAVPDSFKVFICYMSGVQDMVVGYMEAPGYANLKKVSNRTSITKDNDCYDLGGAEYTVYNSDGKAVEYLYTDSSGNSNTVELLEGTYTVKETYAPPGYAKDTETYTVKIVSEETSTFTSKEEPITDIIELLLTKNPEGYPHDHGEGDATLKGAIYKFSYYDYLSRPELLKARSAKGDLNGDPTAVWYFVTDERGRIDGQDPEFASGYTSSKLYKDKNGKTAYPLGTYLIQEVEPSTGYLLNDEIMTVTIDEDGTDNLHVKTYNEEIKGDETIIRGGVKLAKIDNDLDEAYAQGDATLAGAEFTIYNQSAETIMVGGKEIGKGDAALTITTNADGIAASGDHVLPYGSYLVKETKPSQGYLLNEEWSRAFRIREDGVIIDLTEDKVREAVIRGGVQIIKRDKEIVKSEVLGGADLNGIVMTIKNVSGRDVVVRKDFGDDSVKVDWKKLETKKALFDDGTVLRVPSGKDVGKITVHWNEEKKAYTAETLSDDLPYGTYTIRESKTNDTYQRTDKTEHMFEIREDGVIVAYDDGKNEAALTFDNYVYRSDLQGTKIGDGNSERFSYVPFKITSVTNDESHVVVADMNGYFSTKDQRTQDKIDEDEDADNTRGQNPFDDLLTAEKITTAEIKERKEDIKQGVWFGTGEFDSKAPMDGNSGALPYDTYIIEELPCEKNEGYTLQKFQFTVDDKSRNGSVDLGTITDDIPEIGTEASVDGKNADVRPDKTITLIDKISYSGLKRGETYIAKGRLIDKSTGEVVKDAAGKEVTAEQEFKPILSSGSVKVKFEFDGSNLYGKNTVVFEQLFGADGHIVAKHEEIDDEGQTVTWEHLKPSYEMYKIRTTKAPSKGDKYGFFAQDEVEYEVYVENTGNVVLTMDVSDKFTQNPEFFTEPKLKDVAFSGEGIWNNKADYVKETTADNTAAEEKAVQPEDTTAEAETSDSTGDVAVQGDIANITINPGETAIVTYTAVVKDEAKEYLAANAKDSDSLDDKKHDTNKEYQKNQPDDNDGYWNTAYCENVTYPKPDNPDEPGTLDSKEDVAQTPVQEPEIGTTLADEKGNKSVVASDKTTLVDTISYKGLDPSKWYVFKGMLIVKDTREPYVENGEYLEVSSEPFQPKKSEGKAKVTFTINTSKLAGKELVAFETAYRLDDYKEGDKISSTKKTVVAEHKDFDDEGQTVKITKASKSDTPGKDTPKTGDDRNLWMWLGLIAAGAALTGGSIFLIRRK